jgi:hypothetical protein
MGTTKIPPLFSKDKKLEALIGCVLADPIGCPEILDLSIRLCKNIVSSSAYVPGSVYLGQVLCLDYFFSASGWVKKLKGAGGRGKRF